MSLVDNKITAAIVAGATVLGCLAGGVLVKTYDKAFSLDGEVSSLVLKSVRDGKIDEAKIMLGSDLRKAEDELSNDKDNKVLSARVALEKARIDVLVAKCKLEVASKESKKAASDELKNAVKTLKDAKAELSRAEKEAKEAAKAAKKEEKNHEPKNDDQGPKTEEEDDREADTQ